MGSPHEGEPKKAAGAAHAEGTWLPSWDGALYASNTAHHRVYDEAFLRGLPLAAAKRVLDIGCGAGDLTRKVADAVLYGEVVGLDPQPSLLDEARRRAAPNQTFVWASAQSLGAVFPERGTFDGVLSRAALHWVPLADHVGLLSAVRGLLKPGGFFRLEMGGAGNIPRVKPVLDACSAELGGPTSPWAFPDAGTYWSLLEEAGWTMTADASSGEAGFVRTVAQRRQFDRDTLVGWLRSQVYQAYEHGLPRERHAAFRASAEARIGEMRRRDGTYDQTFVRLDVAVRA